MTDQPSIEIAGILIQEPIVTLTDMLVSAVCFSSFIVLQNQKRTDRVFVISKYSILLLGISCLIGGIIGHAFNYAFGDEYKLIGWIMGMTSVALFERAAIFYAREHSRKGWSKLFSTLNIIELVILVLLTIYFLKFHLVELHGLYGILLVVASFFGFVYYKSKDKASKNVLIGVVFCLVAAIVHVSQFQLSIWFNHKDFGHVMLATSAFFFHRGFMRLEVI